MKEVNTAPHSKQDHRNARIYVDREHLETALAAGFLPEEIEVTDPDTSSGDETNRSARGR